jgi:hypothetical protein
MGNWVGNTVIWRKAVPGGGDHPGRESVATEGLGMDALRGFLEALKRHATAGQNFLGLLNVLIGRRIEKADGKVVSTGVTWREAAALLKKVRWDREAVRQLGLDPAGLPPRDRQKYWYTAIAHAAVDSAQATEAGDRLALDFQGSGYVVGPAPKR